MARKQQISLYLPQDVLNIVDNYRNEYKLKNRNMAIERIILEWEMMKTLPIAIEGRVDSDMKDYRKTEEDIKEEILKAEFDKSFNL